MVSWPLACDSGVTHCVQRAIVAAARRPRVTAVGRLGVGPGVPQREPRVVMMNAARRRLVQNLHGGIGGARREDPVVAGSKPLRAGGREAHRDAILQQQRSARSRARRSRRSMPRRRGPAKPSWRRCRTVLSTWPFLVPQRTRRFALRGNVLSGNVVGSMSAGSAGVNEMRRFASSTVMLADLAGRLRELAHVVGDLDPIAGVETQHIVAPERSRAASSVAEMTLATSTPTLALSRDHLNVAPAPG